MRKAATSSRPFFSKRLETALGDPAEVVGDDQYHEDQHRQRDADREGDHRAVRGALVLVDEVEPREEAREDRQKQDDDDDAHRAILLRAAAGDNACGGFISRAAAVAGPLAAEPRRRKGGAPGALPGTHG